VLRCFLGGCNRSPWPRGQLGRWVEHILSRIALQLSQLQAQVVLLSTLVSSNYIEANAAVEHMFTGAAIILVFIHQPTNRYFFIIDYNKHIKEGNGNHGASSKSVSKPKITSLKKVESSSQPCFRYARKTRTKSKNCRKQSIKESSAAYQLEVQSLMLNVSSVISHLHNINLIIFIIHNYHFLVSIYSWLDWNPIASPMSSNHTRNFRNPFPIDLFNSAHST